MGASPERFCVYIVFSTSNRVHDFCMFPSQIKLEPWKRQSRRCILNPRIAGANGNLGAHYTKKSDFRAEFHKLVHEMLTIDEFEDGWAALLDKYSLETNPYLMQICETRQKCAKPYFVGKFCARRTRTGRSESANHMLKQYVPPSCSMNLFVKQYNKLQFDREQEEGFQEKCTRLVRISSCMP